MNEEPHMSPLTHAILRVVAIGIIILLILTSK